MKVLNKMCENVTWMALASQQDREDMRESCIRSVDAWKSVVDALDLLPMFDTIPPFNKVTREVFEKYWLGERPQNPQIYVL